MHIFNARISIHKSKMNAHAKCGCDSLQRSQRVPFVVGVFEPSDRRLPHAGKLGQILLAQPGASPRLEDFRSHINTQSVIVNGSGKFRVGGQLATNDLSKVLCRCHKSP